METVCCVCFKKKKGDKWINGTPRPDHTISHGFCPDCFELVISRVETVAASRSTSDPIAA